MIEMTIDSIRVSLMNYQRVVILKEKYADRYLPIWIGPAEADAIAVRLQDINVPRPLTHDLLCSVFKALGALVSYIVVNDLRNDTFYARIILNVDGKNMEIDSRPSDAIAIAVRIKAPIFVEESVMDKAGIEIDRQTGKPKPSGSVVDAEGKEKKVSEDELRRLSAFQEFINSLDFQDFDKGKGGKGDK